MRGHKKWLALLLSLCMMVGAVPAMAEESVQPVALTEISEQPEAAVGEEPAAEEVPDEEPVILLGDEAPQSDPVNVAGSLSTWQNATVLAKGQVAAPTLSSYDSSFTNNQYWFAVNTDRAQQAIELSFTGVKKTMQVYVYSSETLTDAEPKSNNAIQNWNVGSNGAHSVKTGAQGTYYIMLRPAGSGQTATDPIYMAWDLLDGDLNEKEGGNDTWQTATELTRDVNTYFTFNGQNDVDWFKITTTQPGEAIKLIFSNLDYTVPRLEFRLYSEVQASSNSNSSLVGQTPFTKNYTYHYKVNEPGDYYVRVKPYSSDSYTTHPLKLRYEIVAPDDYEINDTWEQATPLPDAVDMPFTINGQNDEDWFKFETKEPNEVIHLYINGFETDYSNEIQYQIYDAQEGGYNTSALASENYLNKSHSKQISFLSVGMHYLRIRSHGGAVAENDLRLRIERGVVNVDGFEPNDTWQEAVELYEDSEVVFNLPGSTDKDWFKFHVADTDQTAVITFNVPAGGSMYWRLYSGSELETSDESSASLLYGATYVRAGVDSYRYYLKDAGDYYVRLNPDDVFEDEAKISYTLIKPDDNEYNGTWKTATQLNYDVAMPFTISASNDADWFSFTVDEPEQTVEVTLDIPAGGSAYYSLYSEDMFIANGDNSSALQGGVYFGSGVKHIRYLLPASDTYYVKITYDEIIDEKATITYRLIEPDGNEPNRTWRTATLMNEGVTTSFTIPVSNDVDWFSFRTTENDQTVQFDFDIPVTGSMYHFVYSEEAFVINGDGAAAMYGGIYTRSGANTYRYMLKDAGVYYLRLTYYEDIVDAATVTYTLIDPDANERNNRFDTATDLHVGQVASYTLPASSDEDWFKLDSVVPGNKVNIRVGNVGSDNVYVSLHVVKPYEVSTTYVGDLYLRDDRPAGVISVREEGDYYIRLHNDGDDRDQTMTVRYTISGSDNIAVTGISSITNGDSTIFQGKSLQLYANLLPVNATNQEVTWISTSPSVATVNEETGVVTGVAPGTAQITAITKEGSYTATTTITVKPPVKVTGVELRYPAVTDHTGAENDQQPLAKDSSVQMRANVLPADATERGLIWTVSNDAVLSVTKEGRVSAVGTGSAYVTVTTAEGGFSKSFWFNVPDESYPVKGVSLDRSNLTLYVGETEGVQLTASVFPEYADNPSVIWSSDNEAVATVENGKVVPVAQGYATIKVTTVEGSYSAECAVSVQPQRTRVESISFAEKTMELGLYAEIKLQPIFDPVDATDQNVTWESSNLVVATVSRSGVVTALGLGDATITATSADGGHKATIKIKVSLDAPYGDVDNNGDVNVADALLVLQASVGNRTLSDTQKASADVNDDGRCNVADAILILRYSAGLIDAFPAEPK